MTNETSKNDDYEDGIIEVVDDFWEKGSDIDLKITKSLLAVHEERVKFPSYSYIPTLKDWLLMKNMYFPPAGRFFYDNGIIDLRNDGYPANCSLVGIGDFFRSQEKYDKHWDGYSSVAPSISGVVVSIQKRAPKSARVILKKSPVYKVTLWEYFENGIPKKFIDGERADAFFSKGKIIPDTDHVCIRSLSELFQVSPLSERLIPCVRPSKDQVRFEYVKKWAAWAISAHYDKSHLWRVFLPERLISKSGDEFMYGLLEFGIDEEKVKSILYSRSLPVTSAGRKRPIMHWVSAHRRRIKEGIEVDIEQHLRGTNKFNLFGNDFFIAHPTKKGSEKEVAEIEDYYNFIDNCPNTFGFPVEHSE